MKSWQGQDQTATRLDYAGPLINNNDTFGPSPSSSWSLCLCHARLHVSNRDYPEMNGRHNGHCNYTARIISNWMKIGNGLLLNFLIQQNQFFSGKNESTKPILDLHLCNLVICLVKAKGKKVGNGRNSKEPDESWWDRIVHNAEFNETRGE